MNKYIFQYPVRYGKTYTDACKIALRILLEGYTQENKLKCLMLVSREEWKPKEEQRVKQIKEILKRFDEELPKCVEFSVKTLAELKEKEE